ncbi:MAG: hypothetical protein M3O71_25905 [Bacteroidota bacterium]|nr:hypothetical protein [Bacteroidota bacterium]
MKNKYLLFMFVCLLGLSACHKDKSAFQMGQIIGKWQVTKLTLHQVTSASTSAHDTTFTSNAFTAGDFYEFNRDNTALISYSGTYSFGGKEETIEGGTVLISGNHYKYDISSNNLKLTLTDAIPQTLHGNSSFSSSNTINQLDDTHLVLTAVYNYWGTSPNIQGGTLSIAQTTYFTRTN